MASPGNPAPVSAIQAIRYARHERTAEANFNAPVDDHDLPMPLDYFVWAIHRDVHPPVIVDTGFHAEAAAARGREITRPIGKSLRDAVTSAEFRKTREAAGFVEWAVFAASIDETANC